MQPTFTQIKKTALGKLKARWPEAMLVSVSLLAVCLLDMVMQSILMTMFKVGAVWSPFSPTTLPKLSVIASIGISVFSSLFTVFITMPCLFGVLRWFWLLTDERSATLGEIFHYFSSPKLFGRAVALALTLFIKIAILAVICLMPYLLWSIAFDPSLYDHFKISMPIWMSGLFTVTEFLRLMGLLSFAVLALRNLIFYVPLFAEPESDIRSNVKISRKLMHGRFFRFLGFLLSFFGWFLLSSFVLPLIFTLPFFFASLCVYGHEEWRLREKM